MSGPNPPDGGPGDQPLDLPVDDREELTDTGFSRAYSAPESEQYTIAPYLPAELELFDTTGRMTVAPADSAHLMDETSTR